MYACHIATGHVTVNPEPTATCAYCCPRLLLLVLGLAEGDANELHTLSHTHSAKLQPETMNGEKSMSRSRSMARSRAFECQKGRRAKIWHEDTTTCNRGLGPGLCVCDLQNRKAWNLNVTALKHWHPTQNLTNQPGAAKDPEFRSLSFPRSKQTSRYIGGRALLSIPAVVSISKEILLAGLQAVLKRCPMPRLLIIRAALHVDGGTCPPQRGKFKTGFLAHGPNPTWPCRSRDGD